MNQMIDLSDPRDLKVINGWLAETRIRAVRNVLLGSAAIIIAAGLGTAAIVWASGQGTDPEALKQALATLPPLKVETSGTVSLKDGAQVALKDGGEVALKDGAKVAVEGKVDVAGGPVPPAAQRPVPKGIKRSVTVFSEAVWRDGKVVTGWEFASSGAAKPNSQYCYVEWTDADGVTARIVHLVRDGVPYPVKISGAADARSRCIWWREGAT